MNEEYFTTDFEVLSKYETASGKHIEKRIKNYTGKAHGKDHGFEVGKFYRNYFKKDHNVKYWRSVRWYSLANCANILLVGEANS